MKMCWIFSLIFRLLKFNVDCIWCKRLLSCANIVPITGFTRDAVLQFLVPDLHIVINLVYVLIIFMLFLVH
jgi:hypothetical protein